MIVTIYTDGSADNSAKIGGYGLVITAKHKGKNIMKKIHSKRYLDTTSNRMEMKAILKALQMVDAGHKIDIHSDSKYCIDTLNLWLIVWINNGKIWEKKNADLWMKIWMKYKDHKDKGSTIHFIWIRGHNGNTLNELADELANKARCQQLHGISCKVNN